MSAIKIQKNSPKLTIWQSCFLLIKKNLEVIPQLCLQVMNPAAPFITPGESFTLWCEKSQGPLWFQLLQQQSFHLQRKSWPLVRNNCQKKFIAFPSNDLLETRKRSRLLRPLFPERVPSTPLTLCASFYPNCPFPKSYHSWKGDLSWRHPCQRNGFWRKSK